MRTGCYDIHDRVKDMNANGLLGSMCFPSFPQFCGQLFARASQKDEALAVALVQAYNDWHIDSWCGAYPGRFIPLALPMMWDVDKMAGEVRRVAEKGCHAVTFSENPVHLGYPSIHSGHWDKFFATCEEVGTVVNVHIGSSSKMVITADDAPMSVLITLSPINIVQAAADFVWSSAAMKPGLLDICAIILSLAMGVILAFDGVAPRERWLVQWAGRDASVKRAERSAPLRPNRSRPRRSLSSNG